VGGNDLNQVRGGFVKSRYLMSILVSKGGTSNISPIWGGRGAILCSKQNIKQDILLIKSITYNTV
jgi:hypothetical protein